MGANTPPPPPDYPEYAELWARAQAAARGPIDPRLCATVERISYNHEWCTAVLGRPHPGARNITTAEAYLIRYAFDADINPPLPAWLVEARQATAEREAEQRHQAQIAANRAAAAWDTLRTAAAERGVVLEVRANTRSATIRSGRRQSLDHATPVSSAYHGKGARTRVFLPGRALCETVNRAYPLQLGGPHAGPATCERCQAWAALVWGIDTP
ncbi:MAG: hypothetical protein EPO06_11980 [Burkholderiaceae bacterium]|nr:MAG: hypothetical protein EPO06_11980 [Burkholderiaceae bacterium]